MKNDLDYKTNLVAKLLFFILLIIGAIYIRSTWLNEESELINRVMIVARTTADLLQPRDVKNLDIAPSDTSKKEYLHLKKNLYSIVANNPQAKFAYLYCKKAGKIFFIADSEPSNSIDYSPPGQEYSEAKTIDQKPLIDGKALITPATKDRWGTWVSTLVPIRDDSTGQILAVFGMDYDITEWNKFIFFHTIEAGLLTISLLSVFIFFVNSRTKNKILNKDINARKLLEKELQDSNNKFNTMFNTHSAFMLLVDPVNYEIIDANQSAANYFGYSITELKRKTFLDISAYPNKEILSENFISLDTTERSFIQHFTKPNGEKRILEVHSSPIELNNKLIQFLVIHDVTERQLAADKFQNEQLLLRTVIENIPDSIYVKDLDCKKTLVNRTELLYAGVKSEDEILGKDDFDFYPEELAEGFFADDQFVIKTGKQILNREEYIIDAYDNKRWLLTSKIPLNDKDSNIIGLVGIGHDITERKSIEEALIQSNLRFTQVSENASEWIWEIDNDGLC